MSTSNNRKQKQTFEEIYNNMCILKRDLYYKDIVKAHADVLVRKTTERIEDIFHQYRNRYISKNDMFTEIESLRCRNYIIDQVVYEKIKYAQKTFCKPRNKRPQQNNNSSSKSTK